MEVLPTGRGKKRCFYNSVSPVTWSERGNSPLPAAKWQRCRRTTTFSHGRMPGAWQGRRCAMTTASLREHTPAMEMNAYSPAETRTCRRNHVISVVGTTRRKSEGSRNNTTSVDGRERERDKETTTESFRQMREARRRFRDFESICVNWKDVTPSGSRCVTRAAWSEASTWAVKWRGPPERMIWKLFFWKFAIALIL